MAMNRDKFRNIVGGITTPEPNPQPVPPAAPEILAEPDAAEAPFVRPDAAGEGRESAKIATTRDQAAAGETRRFAKRGRPKGGKPSAQTGNARKVKVSLFLSETIVNDLYEWAHADRMHPGEMFEAALRPFHEREAKRRKGGKE